MSDLLKFGNTDPSVSTGTAVPFPTEQQMSNSGIVSLAKEIATLRLANKALVKEVNDWKQGAKAEADAGDEARARNVVKDAALKPFADYFEGSLRNIGVGTLVSPPFKLQCFKDAKSALSTNSEASLLAKLKAAEKVVDAVKEIKRKFFIAGYDSGNSEIEAICEAALTEWNTANGEGK